jgi:hypothetical protein
MHIDENKKFDKRNIEKNIKNGIITQKDYEIYLSKLPDAGDKLFSSEETTIESEEFKLRKEEEGTSKKRVAKKKSKGKGK